jgi:hypothetical protein
MNIFGFKVATRCYHRFGGVDSSNFFNSSWTFGPIVAMAAPNQSQSQVGQA